MVLGSCCGVVGVCGSCCWIVVVWDGWCVGWLVCVVVAVR